MSRSRSPKRRKFGMMRIDVGGEFLPLSLFTPSGPVRGGLVGLHPSEDPSRNQPLMRHLATVLPRHGIAVLLHDRRPSLDGRDVQLRRQAEDALAVADRLRAEVGDVPVGLWGWSQGAWAAPLAAGLPGADVAFLILVASVGVSPAAQMRHGTAEQLRRAGFGPAEIAELLTVRGVYESALRGTGDPVEAQRQLDAIADRPWRHLAWLPDRVPAAGAWEDMDFDPQPVFAATRCPVLLVWGEDDPWLPVDDSEATWRAVAGNRLTVLRLPGTGHAPDPDDQLYERALLAHVARAVGAA